MIKIVLLLLLLWVTFRVGMTILLIVMAKRNTELTWKEVLNAYRNTTKK
jgi:hypothetical protein